MKFLAFGKKKCKKKQKRIVVQFELRMSIPSRGRSGSPERFRGASIFFRPATYILSYEIVSGTHGGRSCRLKDTIAVLKREAEQTILDNPPVGGKLTHYTIKARMNGP